MTPARELVPAARHRVGRAPRVFVIRGLGSCLAICLYDGGTRLGGMAHVLLPEPASGASDAGTSPYRFAATAVPELVDRLLLRGARRSALTAKLVGGASMFPVLRRDAEPPIGERNVAGARAALLEEGIPLVARHVGGDGGRTVRFDLSDGRVLVTAPGLRPTVL